MARPLILSTLVLLLAACDMTDTAPPSDTPPSTLGPSISFFTASPQTIISGETTALTWDVSTDATSISIDPGVGSVYGSSITYVAPSATTTYTLTATNANGESSAATTVTVEQGEPEPPEIPDPPEEPEPQEPDLQYWVNSDCGEVSTTYATADGGTAQRDFGNGVVYEAEDVARDTFLYISAQNQCDSGDVTVRIYKRGEVYRETTSSGAYVIATASGSF